MSTVTLRVNGRARSVDVPTDSPLLFVLRNDLGLNGPKFGCGLGQCGACTVLVDGKAVRSCVTPVSSVGSAEVVTIEGLGTAEKPHPVQRAFLDLQAAQCGYCTCGMIVTATALLRDNPRANDSQIRDAFAGHLCRCGTHARVVQAVKRAQTSING
jgi:nicotinate dehydrogenase subunit A